VSGRRDEHHPDLAAARPQQAPPPYLRQEAVRRRPRRPPRQQMALRSPAQQVSPRLGAQGHRPGESSTLSLLDTNTPMLNNVSLRLNYEFYDDAIIWLKIACVFNYELRIIEKLSFFN